MDVMRITRDGVCEELEEIRSSWGISLRAKQFKVKWENQARARLLGHWRAN